jgi:hypothetical protein
MDRRLEELLERGVTALESIAADPILHPETGPPFCPHCGTTNPVIRVQDRAASGPLGEFVIEAHCTTCDNVFYGMPSAYLCVKSVDEIREELSKRAGVENGTYR